MSKKALVHYFEFQTTWKELNGLPEAHLALVAMLSYAVSESNALARIYLCQDHDSTGDRSVDSAINIHRFLILRSWSSRLFEAVDFVQKGKKELRGNPETHPLFENALAELGTLGSGEGYETARDIRHESTNHYSLSAAKKNLNYFPVTMDCNMYLSEKKGNEFFPFGEAMMFHARLNRRWKNVKTKEERERHFATWLKWCLETNAWLSQVQTLFVSKFVFEGLGRNKVKKTAYWVDERLAGNRHDRMTPIYLRFED